MKILAQDMPTDEGLSFEFWKQVITILLSVTGPLIAFFYGLFKYLTTLSEARTKRDKDFVQSVVKEVMDSSLSGIQIGLQEMKRDTHESLNQMNKRIDDVYKKVS